MIKNLTKTDSENRKKITKTMSQPINRPESDLDRLLQMLIKDTPCDFAVKKGGEELKLNISDNGKFLTLTRDQKWEY